MENEGKQGHRGEQIKTNEKSMKTNENYDSPVDFAKFTDPNGSMMLDEF